jgi:hypothetical protein
VSIFELILEDDTIAAVALVYFGAVYFTKLFS